MSRSFGAIWLTTVSPIFTSPSEMSSSPAIMRSAVDLPDPDGPTRIMNSPSLMSRSMFRTASKPSGYRLVILSRTISAIGSFSSLSLHGARGQAGHDAALEEQYEDDDRDGDDDRRGGDVAGWLSELRLAGEERQRGGHCARVVGRRERDREQEVVPAEDEDEDRGRERPGGGQWQDHPTERLERRRAVHLRRLFEIPWDLAVERDERVDRERKRERQVGDDQARIRVVEANRAPHVEQRADRRYRWKHRDRQRSSKDQGLSGEVEPGDCVGGECGENDRDRGRDQGDCDRVDQRVQKRAVVESALEEHLVVLERPLSPRREEAAVAHRLRRLQRERDDPDDRKQREDEDEQEPHAPRRIFPRPPSHLGPWPPLRHADAEQSHERERDHEDGD